MAELTRERIEQIKELAQIKKIDTVLVQEHEAVKLCDLALRALSAPAPQQTAPEQQELIARLLDSGHDLGCGMINKRNYAFVRVCNCTLLARKQAADALSRSLEDGRRAGLPSEHWLSEAAFHLDLQKEIACVTPYSTVGQMIRHIVEKAHELRLLKTPKGGA